jgi:hypothetical protein
VAPCRATKLTLLKKGEKSEALAGRIALVEEEHGLTTKQGRFSSRHVETICGGKTLDRPGTKPNPMTKKTFLLCILSLMLPALTFAASGGKEITLTGKGACAKCCLKEADSCQNVLTVEKNGKKTTYYLVENDISKAFHEQVCKKPTDIVVTATCAKVGDKLELTASQIKLAE